MPNPVQTLNPVQLSQQNRSTSRAIAVSQRTQRQKVEDSATTQTGFWREFDPALGLHRIELADGSSVWAVSGVATGFNNGQVLTVARARGETYARIRVRR